MINGSFKEIPISSTLVSPIFYWKFAKAKLLVKEHKAFGNGAAIPMDKTEMFKLMLFPSHSVVSMDGYKARLMKKSLRQYNKNWRKGKLCFDRSP